MIDEVATQQVLNLYSESTSRADFDTAVSTFTPDGVWEIASSGQKFHGPAAIKEAFETFTAPMDHVVQLNAHGVIRIDGDTATVRSVIRECGRLTDRDVAFDALGFYADSMVRTEDGWKFMSRRFELQGMHNYTLLP